MICQKTWLLRETHFPFVVIQSKMNKFNKAIRLNQGRLLLLDYLKQYELLPCGAVCNLIAKMHNTSKFW